VPGTVVAVVPSAPVVPGVPPAVVVVVTVAFVKLNVPVLPSGSDQLTVHRPGEGI
jgi:hypothetical protein